MGAAPGEWPTSTGQKLAEEAKGRLFAIATVRALA